MQKKQWYNVVSNKGAKTATILIYDVIGGSFFEDGTTAKDFVNTLRDLEKEASTIEIRINSPGGSVWDGIAIFNAIRNSKAEINTYVDGIAYSMAAIIALAGKKIHIADNARMMFHNASVAIRGNAQQLREQADIVQGYDTSLSLALQQRTGLSETDVASKYLNYKDNYINADQAIAQKLADIKLDYKAEGVDNKVIQMNDYTAVIKHYEPAAYFINNQNQNNDMTKFASLLALVTSLEKGSKPTISEIGKAQVELTSENSGLQIVSAEKYNELLSASKDKQTVQDCIALFGEVADGFNLVDAIKALQAENATLRDEDGDSTTRGTGNLPKQERTETVMAEDDINRMLNMVGLGK